MGYEVPSWRCILPLGNSQSILLGFPRMVWAIDCEGPVFNLWAVFHVHVVTPQAPTDDLVGVDVGAPALAMRSRSLALWGQNAEVDLYRVGLDFRHQPILFSVFSTRTKFDRAIAVVMSLHR